MTNSKSVVQFVSGGLHAHIHKWTNVGSKTYNIRNWLGRIRLFPTIEIGKTGINNKFFFSFIFYFFMSNEFFSSMHNCESKTTEKHLTQLWASMKCMMHASMIQLQRWNWCEKYNLFIFYCILYSLSLYDWFWIKINI